MARTSLPPGFRFHPTDIELIKYYLKRKVIGKRIQLDVIAEVDIYKFAPQDLPDQSCLRTKDLEWYFFCPRERKYANGARMNRATESGYWKTTGKDRPVIYNGQNVGMIKTLIFHEGRPPRGNRTDWVMHEYRLEDKNLADSGVIQDLYVLCKIFQKSGLGPRNGAQYGAPFNEEEWDDDEGVACENIFSLAGLTVPPSVLNNNHSAPMGTSSIAPTNICFRSSSASAPSRTMHSPTETLPMVSDNCLSISDYTVVPDAMFSVFDFTENETTLALENDKMEKQVELNQDNILGEAPFIDGDDIFYALADLDTPASFNENGLDLCSEHMLVGDESYLELNDLESPLLPCGSQDNAAYGLPGQQNFYDDPENRIYSGNQYVGIQHDSAFNESLYWPAPPSSDNYDMYNFQQGFEPMLFGTDETENGRNTLFMNAKM